MGFISIEQSDNLFWLGRYAERVYRTIRCFEALCDVMLDIDEHAYKPFCAALNIPDIYKDSLDFIDSYLYEPQNPDSLYSNLSRAYDNGLVLRNTISSPSLSYLQLAMNCMEEGRRNRANALVGRQVMDYLLAFWGSIDEYVASGQERCLIKAGRYLERLDMQIRLGESWESIGVTLGKLERRLIGAKLLYDTNKFRLLLNFAQLADDDEEVREIALENIRTLLL